jgi:hypothetical protein
MASKGRGDDSMLVHMTPNEVQGLQALAMKHGGSLTVNPETGLVEAGFLKKLLPTLIGAGLTFFSGGAINPLMAAGIVGGVETLKTGSLEKGLMAGFGAYGGAGMTESLAGLGNTELVRSTVQSNMPAYAGDPTAYATEVNALRDQAMSEAGKNIPMADRLSAGFSSATASPTDAFNFAKDNFKYGLAAASPIIADAMVPTSTKMPTSAARPGYIRPFSFDPATQSLTQLPPFRAKNGGLLALAGGGDPADDPNARFNTLSGQSKAAYDYLMGQGAYPSMPAAAATQAPIFTPVPKPVGGTGTSSTPPNEVQTGTAGTTGTGPIEAPTQPYMPPVEFNPPIDVDPYDQNNQDAIDKYEEEVGNELYDQNNQDAIDKYEEEAANEQYDQNNQDAINKIEQEVTDENEADERSDFINPYLPPEETPVNPTPEELINRDEFGDLDAAIADRAYDQNNEDAINKYEQEMRDAALAQENPYGDLDAAIGENNARNFREASDIDDATINLDGGNTYSGFDPTSANPTIPVETLTASPANEDVRSILTAGIDPITGIATDNGAAEAAAREQEEAQREEDRRNQEVMGDVQKLANSTTPSEPEPDYYDRGEPVAEPDPVRETESVIEEYPEPVVVEPEFVEPPEYYDPVVVEPPIDEYYDPVVDDSSVIARDEFVPEYVDEGKPGEPAPVEETGYPYVPDYIAPVDGYAEIPDEYTEDVGGGEYTGGGGGGYGGYSGDDYYGGFESGGGFDDLMFDSYHQAANGGLMAAHYARGGMSHLGGYSDGGRLLKGPGDGVSDSIPASIGKHRQPARLADGEFVVPARIVSELGNGSTEAGARKLYAMMDRIQKARSKTVGKNRVATNSRADKHLPA